jgi:hypothetical protein
MRAAKFKYPDEKKIIRYLLNFITGITVESAAVVILMIIAFFISGLCFWIL